MNLGGTFDQPLQVQAATLSFALSLNGSLEIGEARFLAKYFETSMIWYNAKHHKVCSMLRGKTTSERNASPFNANQALSSPEAKRTYLPPF